MLNKLLKLNQDINEAKGQAVEQSINFVESKNTLLFTVLFVGLTLFGWLSAVFVFDGLEILYNIYGFYPVVIFFIISYFTLYLISKFIFKPNIEELEDDTSSFALFSACNRKVWRSAVSIGLGFLHTALFVLYLVNKDLKFF